MTRCPWTAQDQITAEVAAACGVSYHDIGRALGRDHSTVRVHINQAAYKKKKEKSRKWRVLNPDYYSRWLETNYEKKRESERQWAKANPCKARGKVRRWQKANPDYWRRWAKANPEKISYCREAKRESSRRWRKANPQVHREQARRRNAWKRSARRLALCPVTRQQIDTRFALWKDRCAFCGVDANDGRNHGRKRLTVEHVLALTKKGLDDADNIMPACNTCNCSKSNAPVEEWYRRQPFFTEARWRKICRHCPAAVAGQLPLAFCFADKEAP